MHTSSEWLVKVKTNPNKLNSWLASQALAEQEAAVRIQELSLKTCNTKEKKLLQKIAKDESKHADLIKGLCDSRGIPVNTKNTNRYYSTIGIQDLSLDQLYALGYHAEKMRLSRINAICNDAEIDADIREVFTIIKKDEEMHEEVFKRLASIEELLNMKSKHELGAAALGLKL